MSIVVYVVDLIVYLLCGLYDQLQMVLEQVPCRDRNGRYEC